MKHSFFSVRIQILVVFLLCVSTYSALQIWVTKKDVIGDPSLEQKNIQVIKKESPSLSKSPPIVVQEKNRLVSATSVQIKNEIIEVEKKEEKIQNSTTTQTTFTLNEVARIVAAHTDERTLVGVRPITWSESLAQSAQSWANTLAKESCSIRHAPQSIRRGAGENIWFGTNYDIWNVKDMVTDWIAEKSDYVYDTNTCAIGKMCGHYTQIVWSKTESVGCGIVSCQDSGNDARIFVCRYSPAGNIIGQKPY